MAEDPHKVKGSPDVYREVLITNRGTITIDGIEVTIEPTTGWITMGISSGVTIKSRYLDADDNPITSAYSDETQAFQNILAQAGTLAKKVQMQISQTATGQQFTSDITVTFDQPGSSFTSTTLSGTMTYTDTITGDAYTITFINVTANASGNIASGTVSVRMESTTMGLWTVSLTYNSNGSASGTIEGGDDYTATITINADGTGTYTDSSGTHTIDEA